MPERQVELYSQCIKSGRLEPANLALAHSNRGLAYRELGRPEPAFSDSTRSLEIEPDFAPGYLNLGDILRSGGRPTEAITNYDRAIELDPKLATAYSNRGLAYKMIGRPQHALDDFAAALDLEPDFATAYFNRCWTLYDMQRYGAAVADCQQALAHGRDRRLMAYAHNNLGQAHKAKGDYALAVADFQAAIEAMPAYAAPYNNLAWLYATAADPAFRDGVEALRLAREAISRQEQADTIDTLAAAQVENRRYDEAVAQYLRAMRMGGVEVVKAYQHDLKAKGCYHGSIDGSLTLELRRALIVCVHDGRKLGAD
ncbi:MAG: tetratricopeptide repeat protein [Alphaproteobacteria bacterium]|nr:tetratricopeptide repeat protein [Alphaproteobacteria bacterium]MDP6622401.1 tetratricopeptide repeat protein [Alphaproteobacteria bacterium]